MIDLTPLVRRRFIHAAERFDSWPGHLAEVQIRQLRYLLRTAASTSFGRRHFYADMLRLPDEQLLEAYRARVSVAAYEDLRPLIARMLSGEHDILWPGHCRYFAQSSGTSGGASKFIPITAEALRLNHFAGASDAVASYLRLNPASRLFSGKALILGGSFSNTLPASAIGRGVRVGDLSATLIARAPRFAEHFRVPSRRIALMADWEKKLPALVRKASRADVTNLSGVPSWFLVLLQRIMAERQVESMHDVWPHLEVFFHGGISFEPYSEQYRAFTDPARMHFLETYNASEGFIAVQPDFSSTALQLLLDRAIFFEFAPLLPTGELGDPVTIDAVDSSTTYALILSAPSGLWRYSIGDTVRFADPARARFHIAGRTKSYINAFGEELMEHNADAAIAATCRRTGASIANYTAGPVYAEGRRRGRHHWLIEWTVAPDSVDRFAAILDEELRRLNSDYDAKRTADIFLDPLTIDTLPAGTFDRWLTTQGSGKLGGQRKVPRLSPTPHILNSILTLLHP